MTYVDRGGESEGGSRAFCFPVSSQVCMSAGDKIGVRSHSQSPAPRCSGEKGLSETKHEGEGWSWHGGVMIRKSRGEGWGCGGCECVWVGHGDPRLAR